MSTGKCNQSRAPSGEEIPVSAGEETVESSGFNQALLMGSMSSNRSASMYRAAPDLIRHMGAVGRVGFREYGCSECETMHESPKAGQLRAQVGARNVPVSLLSHPLLSCSLSLVVQVS